MKKTFIIIYSTIVSLILIFAITFFAVNIYNENAHGELRTQVRFEKVVNGVKTAFEKNNISTSEKIRQIENTIGDTKDFSYIAILVDGKTSYIFPDDYDASMQSTSNLVISYNRNLNVNGSNIKISAGLYSLRPVSIFENAKVSFFIILIVALLTIILIIYNNHFGKEQTSRIPQKRQRIIYEEENDDIDIEDENEEDENEEDDDDVYEEEIAEEDDEIKSEEKTEEVVIKENEKSSEENKPVLPKEEKAPEKQEELPLKDFEPVEIIPNAEPVQENGLFSPDTGFGWESYLLTRLDNELNRATASELDLALFIIKLDGLGRKNPLMKKICEYLTVEFQFKDLLFEYKDDSICGIKISMNIDNAITFAEKLVAEIKNITSEEIPTVLAGVTTRGIRMVSGERLLKEADEAVKHAAEDPKCPVVGFRADAVKYRKFLETN